MPISFILSDFLANRGLFNNRPNITVCFDVLRREVLANHKSALKRNRQSLVRRMRNRANKSRMKNAIKAIDTAMEEKSVEKTQEALKAVIPIIDRNVGKGVLHKKNASRKVSRLTRRVNAFVAEIQA